MSKAKIFTFKIIKREYRTAKCADCSYSVRVHTEPTVVVDIMALCFVLYVCSEMLWFLLWEFSLIK